jgi:uncharacterized membrane protein YdjX (TVP38/TMEM64 family)
MAEALTVNRKKLFLLLLAAALIGLFFYFDLERFLTLKSLQENRQALAAFFVRHRAAAIGTFLGIYIVQTALSLPGATILSLAGGALFGVLWGTALVNIGATCGATLAFLLTRYLFRDPVLKRFGGRLEKLNRELEREGFSYLLFLRLVPLFPFFLINLAAGLTTLPLRTFFFGTMVGIIPGSFVYVNAGASLASIGSLGEIVSARVLGSFALLGLFALVPVFYRKFRRKKREEA